MHACNYMCINKLSTGWGVQNSKPQPSPRTPQNQSQKQKRQVGEKLAITQGRE